MSHLKDILTSTRLKAIFKLPIPEPKDTPPVPEHRLSSGQPEDEWKKQCWEPLLALSKIGLKNAPDFMTFLPEPSDAEFPEQAVGMLVLLDQATRRLCIGVDERWRNAYFDELALGFAKQLHELPAKQSIEPKERWIDELGYTFEHWCIIRILLAAPFAHAEDMAMQRIQTAMTVFWRNETEKHYNTKDPHYAKDSGLADSEDVLAFSKIAHTGGPGSGKMVDLAFWFCWIMDAHPPIIRVFGHYPYRNAAIGRSTTEKEKKFLEDTKHYGEVDQESAKKIKEDIEAGRWTPLGGSNP
jgi:uncharacterized protein (DUF924 family)